MESRTIHEQCAWLGACASFVRARSMRLTGAFIALCALVAYGEHRQAASATPVLSYNGSVSFPAVIGESMALTPAVFWTIGHYTVSPPLPPGLSLDEQSGVISGTPGCEALEAVSQVRVSAATVCGTLCHDVRHPS